MSCPPRKPRMATTLLAIRLIITTLITSSCELIPRIIAVPSHIVAITPAVYGYFTNRMTSLNIPLLYHISSDNTSYFALGASVGASTFFARFSAAFFAALGCAAFILLTNVLKSAGSLSATRSSHLLMVSIA